MAGSALSPDEAKAYERNLRKFYLFRFFVDFQLWLPIWVVYLQEERGLSLTQITALDAPFWLVLIAMEVPTGAVADRFGRRTSLIWGAFANAIAVFAFGIADNYAILMASYLAWAVAWTLFSGADAAFFYDSLKALGREGDYQKLWGRVRAVSAVGAILGLQIGAPLAEVTNLWFPVVASAGLMALAWVVSLAFREPPRHEEGETALSYLQGTKEAVRIVFRRPPVRSMMLLAATVTGIGVSVQILQQPFLDSHGVEVGQFGLFLTPGQLLGIAAALLAYRITARFGTNRVIFAMPLIVMTAATGLGAWDSLGAFVFYPLSSMVFSMSFPVISDYLNQRIPSASRATVLSLYQVIWSLVIAGMEPLLGAIGDAQGLPVAYRTAAILLAITSAPLLAIWLRATRKERLGEPPQLPEPEPARPS